MLEKLKTLVTEDVVEILKYYEKKLSQIGVINKECVYGEPEARAHPLSNSKHPGHYRSIEKTPLQEHNYQNINNSTTPFLLNYQTEKYGPLKKTNSV